MYHTQDVPSWLIMVENRKVNRMQDLRTIDRWIQSIPGGEDLDDVPHRRALGHVLETAEKHLDDDTDVFILENTQGDELHFCRPDFQPLRGYIATVNNGATP